jgi:hypothetical protein
VRLRLRHDIGVPVVRHNLMAALLQPGNHIHAHLAQADESELHDVPFCLMRWRARCRRRF